MTALTENRYTKHRDGLITAHPVKGSTHIYKGSMVCTDSSGYIVSGADASDLTFMGVALEEANNTAGDGEISVRVQKAGVFSFDSSGAITQADLGASLYISDDQTVCLAGSSTNSVYVGTLEGIDSAGLWVRVQL